VKIVHATGIDGARHARGTVVVIDVLRAFSVSAYALAGGARECRLVRTVAEARALAGEEHREVIAAIRKLPDRQREALVLRFYLDMDEDEVAEAMRISRGSVKSATSRAIAALGRMLREGS